MKLIPTSINPVTITLYQGIPFDNNYNDHTLNYPFKYKTIANVEHDVGHSSPTAFIDIMNDDSYVYPRTTKTGTYNFAFGNGLVTSVVMELTDNEINSNYMKVVSGSDTYYYFITGLTQRNECTYILNLELDVIMTYGNQFMTNMKDIPVMIERKHARRLLKNVGPIGRRYTRYNPICFRQDKLFVDMKANIFKKSTALELTGFKGVSDINLDEYFNMGIMWCYVIFGKGEQSNNFWRDYVENETRYPYCVVVFPLTEYWSIYNENTLVQRWSIQTLLTDHIVGVPEVQKIIISPFPPFKDVSNLRSITYVSADDELKFDTNTNNSFGTDSEFEFVQDDYTMPVLAKGFGGEFVYKDINNIFDETTPDITASKDVGEIKLQIAPFKTLKMSSFFGEELDIRNEYRLLQNVNQNWNKIGFASTVSSNPESNEIYNHALLNNSIDTKGGLCDILNYTFPIGTNAETLFNETNSNQYANSKLMSTLSNMIKIGGGALALYFGKSPMSKGAGAMALASGIEGQIDTISSTVAKYQDLKNTPYSYTFSGNSLPFDL